MNIHFLTKIFTFIRDEIPRNTWRKDTSVDESKLKQEIDYVINQSAELHLLISILFERKDKTADNIFNSISEIISYLNFEDHANKLAGSILLEILNSFPQNNSETVLNKLSDNSTGHIWSVLNSLPYVFSHYKLEPSFAAQWFFKVGEKIKDNLVSGDIFNALDNYAYNFPDEGLKVFHIYLDQDFIGLQEVMSAIIIGSVRSAIRNKKLSININTIEKKLVNSSNENYRYIFYKSWIITYSRKEASYEEVMLLVKQAIHGKDKEISEAFFILFRIIIKDINEDKIILPTLDWIKSNLSNKLPADAKFHIINILYWLITYDKNSENIDTRKEIYLYIFNKILPIETTYLGTWRKVEELLTSLINKGKDDLFKRCFNIIIDISLDQFLELLLNDHFQSLEYYLKGQLAYSLFTQLLFSGREKDVRTAIELFKKVKEVSIINNDQEPSEEILSTILLEFSRNVLLARGSSKFLLLIEPFFRNVSNDLRIEFIREMVFQAVNYRGTCFDEWSKIENPSDILKEVIENAKKYYSKLEKVSDLPARNFSYYKFEEGAELERKMQSRDLNKKVKEKSVFLSLIRHTQILYGDSWAVQDHVNGGQANKFNEISYSAEFPRIENIDPEGMVLKRMFMHSTIKCK